MSGYHCSDCIFASFTQNEHTGLYQGACARGYTLADPHVSKRPDMFFCDRKEGLVPVIDPYGKEYLRTKNVCERFQPDEQDIPQRRGRRDPLFGQGR